MSEITDRRRALRQEARERQQEVVPRLREAVKEARAHKRARLSTIRQRCKNRRSSDTVRAKDAMRKLRERIAATKIKAREVCRLSKARATETELDAIETAIGRLVDERAAIGELRQRARRLTDPRGQAGGLRSAELRAESDDEVRQELGDDPTLLAVFERVRTKIKPGKYSSRAEAFFDHVHNHPEEIDEVIAAQQAKWDREAEAMLGALAKAPPARLQEDELERYARDLDIADRLLIQHPVSTAEVPF